MKNKNAFRFLMLAVILLIQILTLSAQKGSARQQECVDNPPVTHCIEITTLGNKGEYLGYHRIIDSNNLMATKEDYYSNTEDFFSKKHVYLLKSNNKYYLDIGGDKTTTITVKDDGNITTNNQIALDTKILKKIKFNTVEVFINTDKFEGYYFLYIFRPKLFAKENNCSFSKSPQVEINDGNCPKARTPNNPIILVPNLKYYVELYGYGYTENTVNFDVDKFGKISKMNRQDIATEESNELIFRTVEFSVEAQYQNEKIRLGNFKYNLTKGITKKIFIIPYTSAPLRLESLDCNNNLTIQTYATAANAPKQWKIFPTNMAWNTQSKESTITHYFVFSLP